MAWAWRIAATGIDDNGAADSGLAEDFGGAGGGWAGEAAAAAAAGGGGLFFSAGAAGFGASAFGSSLGAAWPRNDLINVIFLII